jgi:hypothetical protein
VRPLIPESGAPVEFEFQITPANAPCADHSGGETWRGGLKREVAKEANIFLVSNPKGLGELRALAFQ